mmetsp:Transcript_23040/g.28577  ORF Transcript_23040/g.28577 Transcript_23040/m.28577 type:complete len:100 (+) Transcript_23040:561-860(+)
MFKAAKNAYRNYEKKIPMPKTAQDVRDDSYMSGREIETGQGLSKLGDALMLDQRPMPTRLSTFSSRDFFSGKARREEMSHCDTNIDYLASPEYEEQKNE